MTDQKISDLPPIVSTLSSDIGEISSGGVSYRETRTQRVQYTVANLTTSAPYNIGDIFYANTSATLNTLPDVATGNVLLSGGVGVAPSWGKVNLNTTVTGILPVANGGTGTSVGPVVISWDGSTTPVNVTAGSNVTITGGVISSSASSSSVTLTGDVTGTGTGTIPTILATVNSDIGSFGDASHVASIVVNAKGLTTSASNILITPSGIGAPTTTGIGATGTWGINISGNAATATTASSITGGYVSSITGTPGQVIASSATGSVTLSLPQNIDNTSSPQFSNLTLTGQLITHNILGPSGIPLNISAVNNTAINISGGTTSISGQFGGAIVVNAGSGTGGGTAGGGSLTLLGGDSSSITGNGGNIYLSAGNSTGGIGGDAVVNAGTGLTPGKILLNTGIVNVNSLSASMLVATDSSKNLISVAAPSGGVTSITGTANQVIASSSTGAVTLSLPQSIATTSTPTFSSMTLTNVGGASLTAANITAGSGNSLNLTTTTNLAINATAGNTSTSGQFGGAIAINAGTGTGAGSAGGGAASLSAGPAVSLTGAGGPLSLSAGNAIAGSGGSVTITGGASQGSTSGGITLNAGNGTSSATTGGNITLNAGTVVSGTAGKILLNTGVVNINNLTASQLVTTNSSKDLISTPVSDLYKRTTQNLSLTTQTEILIAVCPFTNLSAVTNSSGYYILSITEISNLRQLIVFFQLTATRYNIGYPADSLSPFAVPNLTVTEVNDTDNIINVMNVYQHLTFLVRTRTIAPNMYSAVTVKMSGGLLYGSSALTYSCTSYGECFLQDNPTITQYISTPYSNLNAVAPSIPYGLINTSYISKSNPIGANLFLYCVNFAGNNVNMYTINTVTGLLTNNSPSTLTIGNTPRNIIVSKDGRYAYATNSVSTNIQMMLLDVSTGLLTNNSTATIAAGTNPSYMVIYPAYQNYLYVTNRGTATVGGYGLDRTTGLLSALSPATTAVGNNPIGIAMTNAASPNTTFLYVANNVGATISMFSVSPVTGALTALSPATIAKTGAYHILIHPNGLFLYVSSDNSSLIGVYSINTSTGQLTLVQSASSGNTTREMAITPNGAFLYALNNGANNIQMYSVSLTTGQLTVLSPATVSLTNPTSIKMSPNGSFVYVSSGTSNNVTVYSIDQSTGQLTVAGSIAAGTNAFSVTIF